MAFVKNITQECKEMEQLKKWYAEDHEEQKMKWKNTS